MSDRTEGCNAEHLKMWIADLIDKIEVTQGHERFVLVKNKLELELKLKQLKDKK